MAFSGYRLCPSSDILMRMIRSIVTASLFLCFSFAALAADVTGKWTAQVPSRQGGPRSKAFNFKADGDKLTGTISGRQGDIAIADGKISGDTICFHCEDAVRRQRG